MAKAKKTKSKTKKTEEKEDYNYPEAPTFEGSSKFALAQEEKSDSNNLIYMGLFVLIVAMVIGLFAFTRSNIDDANNTSAGYSVKPIYAMSNEIDGEVEVSLSGNGSFKDLEETDQLQSGAEIKTGDRSFVSIVFDNGSIARIDENSTVRVLASTEERVRLENVEGRLYSRVRNVNASIYEVVVGSETFTAEGTSFMTTSSDFEKSIMVFHGSVTPQSNNSISITEGQRLTVGADELEITIFAADSGEGLRFISLNKSRDSANPEFSAQLGILEEF